MRLELLKAIHRSGVDDIAQSARHRDPRLPSSAGAAVVEGQPKSDV